MDVRVTPQDAGTLTGRKTRVPAATGLREEQWGDLQMNDKEEWLMLKGLGGKTKELLAGWQGQGPHGRCIVST